MKDLTQNIHGVAPVADVHEDEGVDMMSDIKWRT